MADPARAPGEVPVSHGGGPYIRVGDGTAIGTIVNDDPMPKAWIARFGRTVAEQVMEAVEERLDGAPDPGMGLTIADRPVGGGAAPEELEDREAEAHGGCAETGKRTARPGPERRR